MNDQPQNVVTALHRWHRRRQWAWPAGTAMAGLLVTEIAVLILAQAGTGRLPHPDLARLWLTALGATAVLTLVACRAARRPREHTARDLDRRWSARNRLETVDALAFSAGPLAEAQRAETVAFLGSQMRPAAAAERPAVLVIAALLLLQAATCAWWRHGVRVQAAALVPPVPPPSAEITWKAPASEVKAAKIEELPLEAIAVSDSGLDGLRLEITVNGEPRKTVPLPAAPFDRPGAHPVSASICLDEVGVEPFDMVSYHLRAQRRHTSPLPATASPIQFIQIRPFREDAVEMKGVDAGRQRVLTAVLNLKAAQLAALKQNFVLANTELAVDNPLRREENDRVGHEQAELAAAARAMISALEEQSLPTDMVDLLTQASPLMEEAARLILKPDNAAAATGQERALGLLTKLEKNLIKAYFCPTPAQAAAASKPAADPFKEDQTFALKPRGQTPAGQLEALVRQQAEVVNDLSRPEADAAAGGPTNAPLPEVQDRIGGGLVQLLKDEALGAETQPQLRAARAAEQLHADDREAAVEPAARALQAMKEALAQMEEKGREDGLAAAAQAQRDFNRAAQSQTAAGGAATNPAPDPGQTAEAVRQAGLALQAAAARQQAVGSEAVAAQLKQLADELARKRILPTLDKLRQNPGDTNAAQAVIGTLDELALAAADAGVKMSPSREATARLMQDLQRVRANLKRLSEAPAGPAADQARLERELSEDLAGAVQQTLIQVTGTSGQRDAEAILEQLRQRHYVPAAARYRDVAGPLDRLIEILQGTLAASRREEVLAPFRPEEVPPPYRRPVSEYFERLSRDPAATRRPAGGAAPRRERHDDQVNGT
jgi:hypothetical protein